jgi:hypothetical protein
MVFREFLVVFRIVNSIAQTKTKYISDQINNIAIVARKQVIHVDY